MRHVISALVINEPGVLANVAGMFAARGFNIDSLVVGRTDDPALSRMTIVVDADDNTLEQVRKQLAKLVPVTGVHDFAGSRYVERDLALVRIAATAGNRGEVIQIANVFGGRIVDVADISLIVELTGAEDKIEDFLELVRPYGVTELARTGVIAMARGIQPAIDPAQAGQAASGSVKRKRSINAPPTVALPPS
jgi:acetolactate synthase-1/3 small subunit